MSERPHTIDLNTPEGIVEHMATLPTENLRRIAAREIHYGPASNVVLVTAAECELILRDAGLGERHSIEALRIHREKQDSAPMHCTEFVEGDPNGCARCGERRDLHGAPA